MHSFPAYFSSYKEPKLQIKLMKLFAIYGEQSKKSLVGLEHNNELKKIEVEIDVDKKKKKINEFYSKYYPNISVAVDELKEKKMLQFTGSKKGMVKTRDGAGYPSKPQDYYFITDDSLNWLVNNNRLFNEELWLAILNSFTKTIKRFTISINEIFNMHKKKLGIPKSLINPLGSAMTLNLLKNLKDNEYYIWMLDRKNCKTQAISILKVYASKDQDEILKLHKKCYDDDVLSELLDRIGKQQLICIDETDEKRQYSKLSIFGILYLLADDLSNPQEKEKIIEQNRDELPLVFGKKIWSDIKQLLSKTPTKTPHSSSFDLKTIDEIIKSITDHEEKAKFIKFLSSSILKNPFSSLTEPFMKGFAQVFAESIDRPELTHLKKLFDVEYGAYPKLERLGDSGRKVLLPLAENNHCSEEYEKYLRGHHPIPQCFKKDERIHSELQYLVQLTHENNSGDLRQVTFGNVDFIQKPIQEAVSFFFYSYLRSELDLGEKEWNAFLEQNPTVKEMWERWNQEIRVYQTTIT